MAKFIKTSIKGIPSAKAFLKKKETQKFKRIDNAIHKQGFILEGEVKDSIAGRKSEPTSVDTGKFLNSVETDNSKELQSQVFSDVEYSKFLENGTSKIGARHHFRNSLDRRRQEIKIAVAEATAK